MRAVFRLTALLVLLGICGCISTPPEPIRPAVPPLRQATRKGVERRCAQLKKLLLPLKVRGIGLFHRAFELGYAPEEVCQFIRAAGFNRIYFHITSETELDGDLEKFLIAAEKVALPVEIVIRQGNFYPRSRGNYLLQQIRPRYPLLPEAVEHVVKYNQSLPPEAGKIDGITIVVEPHKFTAGHGGIGQIFAWDEKAYGPGRDNDMLVRETFDMLAALRPGDLPLTIAVPDFFQELAAEKKITKGTVLDFLSAHPSVSHLMILSTAHKPSDVVKGTLSELAVTEKNHKVLLGIELSAHASLTEQKLRRRDWKDLTRILSYVLGEHRKHAEFCGVMITPLAVLEHLILEQE
ncbi:MAG: hypothetical protein IKC65_04630 [Lentisphaeria bacterium]|nr:hypothetical protein [Lentisphaeria bacterium]